MTRRSQVSLERKRNLIEVRRQRVATGFRGFTPLELYDIWGRCYAYYDGHVPEVPQPSVMEQATLEGTICRWFPSIGQSLETISQ